MDRLLGVIILCIMMLVAPAFGFEFNNKTYSVKSVADMQIMNSIALKQTDVISAATMMALAFKEYTETSDFEFYKITKLQFFHFGDECLEYNVLIENIIERLHSVGYFNGDFSMDDQPAAKLITSNRRKFINSDAIDLNRSSQKSYKEKIYFKNKKPDLGSRNAGLSIPAIISKKKAKSRKRKREQKILRKIKQS